MIGKIQKKDDGNPSHIREYFAVFDAWSHGTSISNNLWGRGSISQMTKKEQQEKGMKIVLLSGSPKLSDRRVALRELRHLSFCLYFHYDDTYTVC